MKLTLLDSIIIGLFIVYAVFDIINSRRARDIFRVFPVWLQILPGSGFLSFFLNRLKGKSRDRIIFLLEKRKELR